MTDHRILYLEADCDLRCAELLMLAIGVPADEWDLDRVSSFVRAAYAQGYADSLRDPRPEEFFHKHGYRAPKRRAA